MQTPLTGAAQGKKLMCIIIIKIKVSCNLLGRLIMLE